MKRLSRYSLEIQEIIDSHLKDKFSKKAIPYLLNPSRRRYIRHLKPKQLAAYILSKVHHFSIQFISKSLSISRPTVTRYIKCADIVLNKNCGIE